MATSFVLKQKKQKFKSPPACFFSHMAFTLQSRAAPQAPYILPRLSHRAFASAKFKRPLPLRAGQLVLPAFRPKLGRMTRLKIKPRETGGFAS
jgi:hypothetical protein